MKLKYFLWTLLPLTLLKLGFDLFGFYLILEYNIEPFDLGIVSGSISILFWLVLIGTIIFIAIKSKQLEKNEIYSTFLLSVLVVSFVFVDKTSLRESLYEEYISDNVMMEDPADLTPNDVAEIQVIDLLHLVETGNKKVFAELVAYSGPDKKRFLKHPLDPSLKEEKETNDLYFEQLRKIVDYCYELKPSTGKFDTEYSFVMTDSRIIQKDNRQIIRVKMNFCLPDEVKCIEDAFHFDFIEGDKRILLVDINDMKLYE